MTYTTKPNDDDLLYGNEWDDFATDILEEFEERKGGGRRGCLRVIILLLLIVILLGAGAFYITTRPSEEDKDFEDAGQSWLENASNVVDNYEAAVAAETLDCTTVLSEDPAYHLEEIPAYDGSDDDLSEVHALLTNIERQVLEIRADMTPVCGTNITISNEAWVSLARPEANITNARRDIQQAEDLLGGS
jgi:hypothetical protein